MRTNCPQHSAKLWTNIQQLLILGQIVHSTVQNCSQTLSSCHIRTNCPQHSAKLWTNIKQLLILEQIFHSTVLNSGQTLSSCSYKNNWHIARCKTVDKHLAAAHIRTNCLYHSAKLWTNIEEMPAAAHTITNCPQHCAKLQTNIEQLPYQEKLPIAQCQKVDKH